MLAHTIPFELHITVSGIDAVHEQDFISQCAKQNGKALLIELARGEHMQQPMLSKVIYADGIDKAIADVGIEADILAANGFHVERIKIEVPAMYANLFEAVYNKDMYYEWHCKVEYSNVDSLLDLCNEHKVHLSRNALKNEADRRFITLREYGSKEHFEERIAMLIDALNNKCTVQKQHAEYCVYDSNTLLDNGWLANN